MQAVALEQGEGLALGQAHDVGDGDHGHLLARDPVLVTRHEIGAGRAIGVGDAGNHGEERDIHLGQLIDQKLRSGVRLHAHHHDVVEVAQDLLCLGRVADAGLDVGHGLGIGMDHEAGAAHLVHHGHELGADELVDLVEVAGHFGEHDLPFRVMRIEPGLVELAAHAHQIGQHGVAHGAGDGRIRERIEPHIDDAALTDHLHPVEDRALVAGVEVVR